MGWGYLEATACMSVAFFGIDPILLRFIPDIYRLTRPRQAFFRLSCAIEHPASADRG